MKVLVIGASGTIGSAVTKELASRYQVIRASRTQGDLKVDLGDPASIKNLFQQLSGLRAVVCVAGPAAYGPLFQLTDANFEFGFVAKLMGQVNLIRYGINSVLENGSFTLTGGTASRRPMDHGGVSISMMNAALEGFVRAAALELPRGIRVNVVAPGWVAETRVALGLDGAGGLPAAVIAKTYIEAFDGSMTGQVLDADIQME